MHREEYETRANVLIGGGFTVTMLGAFVSYVLVGKLATIEDALLLLGGLGFRLIGTAFFVWGCCLYAKSKRQPAVWGLLGILSLPGFVVLALLRDRNDDPLPPESQGFPVIFVANYPPPVPAIGAATDVTKE